MFKLIELITSVDYRLMNIITPTLKIENLSASEFIVLWKVNKKASRITDLAKAAGVLPSTMTAMFDRLASRGYVKRVHDELDRRSVLISGTPKLREMIDRVNREVDIQWKNSSGMIPGEFLEQFIRDLETMRDYLEPLKGEHTNGSC
jgi:Transcriptional regulators